MVTLCWAAKGGSGTTVVTAILALSARTPTLIVDLDGEIPSALGLPDPDRPGVADWLESDAPAAHLENLIVTIDDATTLLPWRGAAAPVNPIAAAAPGDTDRRRDFVDWLARRRPHASGPIDTAPPARRPARRHSFGRVRRSARDAGIEVGAPAPTDVVIDAGTGEPWSELHELATTRLLVSRPCYLSLTRASRCAVGPTGVVLVVEPGRALSTKDVEAAVGAPVVATVSVDPAVARAVDAGLLTVRVPSPIRRELRGAAA